MGRGEGERWRWKRREEGDTCIRKGGNEIERERDMRLVITVSMYIPWDIPSPLAVAVVVPVTVSLLCSSIYWGH